MKIPRAKNNCELLPSQLLSWPDNATAPRDVRGSGGGSVAATMGRPPPPSCREGGALRHPLPLSDHHNQNKIFRASLYSPRGYRDVRKVLFWIPPIDFPEGMAPGVAVG